MKKLVLVVFFISLLVFAGLSWQAIEFMSKGPMEKGQGQDKIFEVQPGEGFYKVASRLHSEGIITSSQYFKLLARFYGYTNGLKVGEYAVRTDLRPIEVLQILSSGQSIERQVTIPEGYSLYEIAHLFEQKGISTAEAFLKRATDPDFIYSLLNEKLPSLEGYLFPETYKYTKYTSLDSILKNMLSRFNQVYDSVGFDDSLPYGKHQIVTLASMIEKETGAPHERPLIASVFFNRIKKNMKFQSDPTIIYGIWSETGVWKKNISKEDILKPTDYNTYTVPRLPKGPISSPGKESLEAVKNPANSDFLFFVSKNDGTHTFSSSLSDHNSAVQKFQVDKKAREGKSWRDLKKSPAKTQKPKAKG